MSGDLHQRAKEIFLKAIELSPQERPVFLDRECGENAELRAEVDSLLEHAEEESMTVLRSPASVEPYESARGPVSNLVGQFIGPYKLLSVLGEGGFGVVYLAERREPMVQRVALKVIKPGMDSKEVIARFEQERQALAVMDHPNVAKVFDAGTTSPAQGTHPYFVMEHVQGEPITEYCDRQTLTIKQRLELFIPVCEAVQHAHHKGIIHRDLKPSNILVTIRDGKPAPKVIDFGVAKAITHTLTEKTIFTQEGRIIGTPEYMSPEQAEMGATDIDTRTDVYSLGVVLYELLTGALPFDEAYLRNKGYDEIRRIIREEDPPRPSTKLTASGEKSLVIARKRQAQRDDLVKELRQELEWIPLKAMRKDRADRYETPQILAKDVERYLRGDALEAGPESTAYRLRKLIRRNKGPVAAVSGVMFVLTVGMIATALALAEASRQRNDAIAARNSESDAKQAEKDRADELEKVAEFQASQLSEIDAALMGVRIRGGIIEKRRASMAARGTDETDIEAALRELEQSIAGVNFTNVALETLDENIFERALKAIDTQFANQPLVKARLLQTLAETMRELGLLDRATSPQEEALAIRRRVLGDEHPDTLNSTASMGYLLQSQGKHDQAEMLLREDLEKRRRLFGNEHPETLVSINNFVSLLQVQGKLEQAEPYFLEAVERMRSMLGDVLDGEHSETAVSINNLGILLKEQGNLTQAELYLREAVQSLSRVLGEDHPDTLASIRNLAYVLRDQGKADEAEPYSRMVLDKSRRLLGDNHPDTLASIEVFGGLLHDQGKFDQAEPYYREAVEMSRRVLGNEHPDTLTAIGNLGVLLRHQGKLDQAEPYYREAVEMSRRGLGNEHPNTLTTIIETGILLRDQGKYDQAEPYFREVMEMQRRVRGENDPRTIASIANLGVLLQDQGKLEQAEPYCREALEKCRRLLGEEHPNTLTSTNNIAALLRDEGKFAEAEAMLLSAVAIAESKLPPGHSVTLGLSESIANLYTAWEQTEPSKGYDVRAAEWKARLAQLQPATQPIADTQPH